MTKNIKQNVVPRNHANNLNKQSCRTWRSLKTKVRNNKWESGFINSHTATAILGVITIFSLAALSFLYLGQVLGTASEGSDIQRLENEIIELRDRQRELELKGARLRSINTIEKDIQNLNLVKTDKVSYLIPHLDRVAALTD